MESELRKDLKIIGTCAGIVVSPALFFGIRRFCYETGNLYHRAKKALISGGIAGIISLAGSAVLDMAIVEGVKVEGVEKVNIKKDEIKYDITLANVNVLRTKEPYILEASIIPCIRPFLPETYERVALGTEFAGTVTRDGIEYDFKGNFTNRVSSSNVTIEALARNTRITGVKRTRENISKIYGVSRENLTDPQF